MDDRGDGQGAERPLDEWWPELKELLATLEQASARVQARSPRPLDEVCQAVERERRRWSRFGRVRLR